MIDQGELFSIPNPCRGICTSNNRGYCKGCLRSRQERFHWNEFSAFQQQLIINLCERRRLKIQADRNPVPDDDDIHDIDQPDLFDLPADPPPDTGDVTSVAALSPDAAKDGITPSGTDLPAKPDSSFPQHGQYDLF
ncbi:DUF1289 domain-containing protein [Thalassolituus sp.]|uniref:DUF1289 domain-containing protein n=1 Tax=Thalassolituus sp. TaxID=2030822 RepID=UPI0035194868